MISVKNLQKYFNRGKPNQIHVIDNVTLALPDKGMIAVFGKSGCGKTTLLNCLGGLDRVQSGQIIINGDAISPNADVARNRSIGFVFQNYNLLPEESVYENVAMSLRLCGMTDALEIDRRVVAALSDVGMEKFRNRRPDSLSGGQQQRVAIARALVKSPAILLCDEPTGNLDEQNTIMVMDLLKQISQEHLVVLVTHEADLVDYYCDRVIEVVDGKIVNDRENADANGYSAKGKTDVYLGDLPENKLEGEGLSLQIFGEIGQEQKIRLISVGGVLYLQAMNHAKLRILDDSCELKVYEGHYIPASNEERPAMDLSAIPPITHVEHAGRCFHFVNALRSGWRANFGKQKKLKKFLTGSLALFAAIIVAMVGNAGTVIRQKQSIRETYSPNTIYVQADHSSQFKPSSLVGQNGVDYFFPYSVFSGGTQYRPNAQTTLNFGLGGFVTADYNNATSLSVEGVFLPVSLAEGKSLLAGKAACENDEEILLSRAAADRLIASAPYTFITDYKDLLGLKYTKWYGGYYGGVDIDSDSEDTGENMLLNLRYTIVGVVEGDESCFYASALAAAYRAIDETFSSFYGAILPASRYTLTANADPLPSGMVDLNRDSSTYYQPGDKMTINGRTYTVRNLIGPEKPDDEKFDDEKFDDEKFDDEKYDSDYKWLKDTYSIFMNDEDYISLLELRDLGISELGTGATLVPGEVVTVTYAIHTNDVDATEKALAGNAEILNIYTPEQAQTNAEADYTDMFISTTVQLVVVLAMMALCLYFVMRSALMSRVREVGIYRAIGVSRKNLVFRFLIETLVLVVCTVFVGYLLSSFMVGAISAIGTLTSEILYYPFWLALITLIGIVAVCIVCGLLPVFLLLRRTPAEILAKYDI